MTFVELLEPIVASLNTNAVGEESNAPLFYASWKSFQNERDDADLTNGIIYLHEPKLSIPSLKLSGYLEEKWSVEFLIGFRGGLDWIPADERPLVDNARELARRFINVLSLSKLVRYVNPLRIIDIFKQYDLSISGCLLVIDITPLNPLSNCLPETEDVEEEILFGLAADYCFDSAAVILVAPDTGGEFAGDGVLLFEGDGNYYFDPSSVSPGSHTIVWIKGITVQRQNVTVHAAPAVTLLPENISIDKDETPVYTLVGGLPLGGTYTLDGEEVTTIDTGVLGAGSFDIFYSYTDANGCQSSAQQTITITDPEVPEDPPVPSPDYTTEIYSNYTKTTYAYLEAGNPFGLPALYVDFYRGIGNTNTDCPVYIGFHPGGGTRESFKTDAKRMAGLGYLGGTADFGPTMPFSGIRQKESALNIFLLNRWCHQNAALLGINPDNIFWGGTSAGASALLQASVSSLDINNAMFTVCSNFAINTLYPGFTSQPRATWTQSGAANSNFVPFIGATNRKNFFKHGTTDITVPYTQALANYNAMIAAGVLSTLVPYIGEAHDIGAHHDDMMNGGDLLLDGITVDPGVIEDFSNEMV